MAENRLSKCVSCGVEYEPRSGQAGLYCSAFCYKKKPPPGRRGSLAFLFNRKKKNA